MGIEAATHEHLLFLDDDNFLPHPAWLTTLVDAYFANPGATGTQCAWFTYQKRDSMVNRWCYLFGMADPLAYYLGRQDHLRYIDRTWNVSGKVLAEGADRWLVRFRLKTCRRLDRKVF